MIRIPDSELFFSKCDEFEHVPYVQSKAWHNYLLSKGEKLVYFIDNQNDTLIAFFGREKRIPATKQKILFVDTPLIKPGLSEKTIRNRLIPLMQANYLGIEIDSISEYNIEFEIGLRRAGFVRPLKLSKCPLTIIIELDKPFNFDTKWKRDVKSASDCGIIVKEVINPAIEDAVTFTMLFKELREKKGLKYDFSSEAIFTLLNGPGIRMFFALENNIVVSAQIIYVNKGYCYSILRANSLRSRVNNASYLVYNTILETLAQEQNIYIDLGRIPPSNHETDKVYHFKNHTRGVKIQYNGEWVYYRKKCVENAMYFYKQLIAKTPRY